MVPSAADRLSNGGHVEQKAIAVAALTLKELQEKGFDAFTFTSPEGQQVDELR